VEDHGRRINDGPYGVAPQAAGGSLTSGPSFPGFPDVIDGRLSGRRIIEPCHHIVLVSFDGRRWLTVQAI
jgi:hypothetical protein